MSDDLLYEYYSNNFSSSSECSIGTLCLVCGESVPIFDYKDVPKICDKCKAAIMAMREQMDRERITDV